MKQLSRIHAIAATLLLTLLGCSEQTAVPGAASEHRHEAPAGKKYHCPMHPTFIKDGPGSCAICGMALVPMEAMPAGGSLIAGRTTVMVATQQQAQIGIATTTVTKRAVTRTFRATATVEVDETRQARINPRIGGWVEELYVNYLGQSVTNGQPLFRLYSPELLAAQKEYLVATRSGDADLRRSARRKLELAGVDGEQIDTLEKTGQTTDTLTLRSPVTGIVMKKSVVRGQSFMPGETLYEIADLSHVWFHAFVYERDIPHTQVGQTALIEVPALGHRAFFAKVTLIYPGFDETTRSVEVRLEADNPDLLLRPDMWATAEFDVELGEGPVVPASAIIDTGRRLVAFVKKSDDTFEPREIREAGRNEDDVLVKSGLKEGDVVVTRALFLLDAESQLKAAILGQMGGSAGTSP